MDINFDQVFVSSASPNFMGPGKLPSVLVPISSECFELKATICNIAVSIYRHRDWLLLRNLQNPSVRKRHIVKNLSKQKSWIFC